MKFCPRRVYFREFLTSREMWGLWRRDWMGYFTAWHSAANAAFAWMKPLAVLGC